MALLPSLRTQDKQEQLEDVRKDSTEMGSSPPVVGTGHASYIGRVTVPLLEELKWRDAIGYF